MSLEITPLTLKLLQGGQTLDAQLLLAARRHVGAAGIEQTAALERLITAGQEHTGVVNAAQQVSDLLERSDGSEELRRLRHDSRRLLLVLEELATVVTRALEQITATPVQHISAQALVDIADQMQRHVTALEQLVEQAERSPEVAEASTPILEEILTQLRLKMAQIANDQMLGRLSSLKELMGQAAHGLAALSHVSVPDRLRALETVLTDVNQQMAVLEARSAREDHEGRNA